MYKADYIIQTADKLVRKYRTRDPYELCEALHIVLYRKDLKKKLKGFFLNDLVSFARTVPEIAFIGVD